MTFPALVHVTCSVFRVSIGLCFTCVDFASSFENCPTYMDSVMCYQCQQNSRCSCIGVIHFSLLTRESIGKEAELEMKLAIVSNALMKVC